MAEVLSGLALSLLLIRVLGPGTYGKYSFIVNAAALAAVLLSMGVPETLMRYVSLLYAQDDIPQIRFLTRRLVLLRLSSYAVGIGLLAAFHGVGRALQLPLLDEYWVPIAGLVVSQGAIEFATSYAFARLQSRDVAIARTVGQIVAVGFFVGMATVGRTDVITAAVTTMISYLLASAMLVSRGLGGVVFAGRGKGTAVRPIAGFAVGVWAATLFNVGLAGQIDVILLGALRHDVVQIALYSVATLVFVKLGVLLSGWAATATSSFADVQTRRGQAASGRLLMVYLRVNLLLALFVYPPLILLSDAITRHVFGPAYAGASGLMAVYGLFWLGSSFLAAGIPLSLLIALGRQQQVVAIRASTGALNVLLDVLLIPSLGALGAIFATGIANVAAHVCDLVFAVRAVEVRFPFLFAIRISAAACVAALPTLLIRPHDLIGSVGCAILYAAIYVAALTLLRPLGSADVEVASRLGPRFRYLTERLANRARPV